MESALSLVWNRGDGIWPHGPPNGQLDGVWLNADCPWEEYTVSWMKSFFVRISTEFAVCGCSLLDG